MTNATSTIIAPDAKSPSCSVLFLLAGLAALGALATNIILPAFARIGEDLGVSSREMALTLSSFFIAFAFGQLFVGPLSDRLGRKWLVLAGLAILVAGCAICAVATSLQVMLVGRVVQAFGSCTAFVLSRAIARDLFDGEVLTQALSFVIVAMAAAPGFSPIIGSGIVNIAGWPALFVAVAVFALGLGAHYIGAIGETLPPDRREARSLLGVAADYGRLLIDPLFISPALAVGLILGALYTFFATAPEILISRMSLTALQMSIFFAATVFIVFAAGSLAPRLAQRFGAPVVGIAGIAFCLTGSLWLWAVAPTPEFSSFAVGVAIFLLGMGLINPLGTSIALHPFGRQAGMASALLGFLQMGFAALGSFLVSALPLSSAVGLGFVMTFAAALALASFLPVMRRH